MLSAVSVNASVALEGLTSNGQPDLRRLLDVAHPLAVDIRGADLELVTVHNKPDRYFVGLASPASIMSQGRSLLSGYLLQSH